MTPKQAAALIGRRVTWRHSEGEHWSREESGVVEDVRGKNVLVDGEWKWLPDLEEIKVVEERV